MLDALPMLRGVWLVCFLLASTWAPRALASPSARLVYARGAGAEACPDEATVRRDVAQRLGYDPFFPWAKQTVVTSIARREQALHADVQLVDEDGRTRGTRALDAASGDCDELVHAVALAVSIAIDPLVLTRPEPAETPAPVAPVPPVAEVAAPPHDVAEASPPAPKAAETSAHDGALRADAGVGGLIASGAAPDTAFGLLGFFDLRRDRVSLGVELRADLPASRDVAGGGRVRSSLLLASLAPCLHLSVPRDAPVFACALASAGQLSGSADGLAHPSSASAFFAAFGGRIGVEAPLGDTFFVRAHGDLLAAVTRHVLTVDDAPAFTVPQLAAVLAFAAGARF